jgi:hypothetical protein
MKKPAKPRRASFTIRSGKYLEERPSDGEIPVIAVMAPGGGCCPHELCNIAKTAPGCLSCGVALVALPRVPSDKGDAQPIDIEFTIGRAL